jgi:hypothetical protein
MLTSTGDYSVRTGIWIETSTLMRSLLCFASVQQSVKTDV